MKRKKILTGILLILVLAGCVVIADYIVSENTTKGTSPPPVNVTLRATPTATPGKGSRHGHGHALTRCCREQIDTGPCPGYPYSNADTRGLHDDAGEPAFHRYRIRPR